MRVRSILRLGLVVMVSACGGDGGESQPAPKRPSAPAASSSAQGALPGAVAKGPDLQTYPKVPPEYRRDLSKDDFVKDATGDYNRDPFKSYLLKAKDTNSTAGRGQSSGKDECAKGTVAEQYGLRDLKLVGIVLRGTMTYVLFTDSQNFGHIAHRGDCLSKDKARLREIGADRVMLEIRGDAPPGAPAPPARDEIWRLHPEELELGAEESGGVRR